MASLGDWPPVEGLSTPTVSREHASFQSVASIRINAPASRVLEVLCDTSRYPAWNTWIPKVTIHSQPSGTPPNSPLLVTGTSFTYHAIMDASKPHKENPTMLVVTDISTPDRPSSYISQETLNHDPGYFSDLSKVYRISWKGEGSFVARGLHTERFHEIIVVGENECEVRTWEVMGGILATTVKWMYKSTLAKKFVIWCEELKKESEEGGAPSA